MSTSSETPTHEEEVEEPGCRYCDTVNALALTRISVMRWGRHTAADNHPVSEYYVCKWCMDDVKALTPVAV